MSNKTLNLCRICRLERVLLDTLKAIRTPDGVIYQCDLRKSHPAGCIRMDFQYEGERGYRIIAYLPDKTIIDVITQEIQYKQATGFRVVLNAADIFAIGGYHQAFNEWVSEMFDHLLMTTVKGKSSEFRIVRRLRAITDGWEETEEDKATLQYEASLLGGVAIDGLFAIRVKSVNPLAVQYRFVRTIGSYLQPKRTKAKLAIIQRTVRQAGLYSPMIPIYETRLVRPAEYFRLMKTLHDKDGLDIVPITSHD